MISVCERDSQNDGECLRCEQFVRFAESDSLFANCSPAQVAESKQEMASNVGKITLTCKSGGTLLSTNWRVQLSELFSAGQSVAINANIMGAPLGVYIKVRANNGQIPCTCKLFQAGHCQRVYSSLWLFSLLLKRKSAFHAQRSIRANGRVWGRSPYLSGFSDGSLDFSR